VSRWSGASPDGDDGEGHNTNALNMMVSHTQKGLGMAQGAGQDAAAATAASRRSTVEALASNAGGADAPATLGAGTVSGQVAQAKKSAAKGDARNSRRR